MSGCYFPQGLAPCEALHYCQSGFAVERSTFRSPGSCAAFHRELTLKGMASKFKSGKISFFMGLGVLYFDSNLYNFIKLQIFL